MGTPVPIPNTEVKHRSGEGSPLGRDQRVAGLFLFGAVSAPFFAAWIYNKRVWELEMLSLI